MKNMSVRGSNSSIPVLGAILALLAIGARDARAHDSKALLTASSRKLGENKPWNTRIEEGEHIAWDTPGWGTLRAAYSRIIKKPDKIKIDQDNSAYDHPFYRAYYMNGEDSWYMVNLNVGRNPNVANNLKRLMERVDGISYYISSADTFLATLELSGDSLLPGKKLYRTGCILRGDTILWDIDSVTKLPLRRIEGSRTFVLEDYRPVAGRIVPFHILVYDEGRKAEEFIWRKVVFDAEIDDSVFEENHP